jgi:hypothetical protein
MALTAKQPVLQELHPELDLKIREALSNLRYGTLTLVIQDGKVVQLDRNEKVRITTS